MGCYNSKQSKNDMYIYVLCVCVRDTLAYIINNVKEIKHIHGFNIHIQTHIIGQENIFLLIKSDITQVTTSISMYANQKN